MAMQECWEDKMRKYIKYLVYNHKIKDGNYYFNTIYYLIICTYFFKIMEHANKEK